MLPNDLITTHFRLVHEQKAALEKLGVRSIRDLLYHIPSRYESAADVREVAHVVPGTEATMYGMFAKLEIKKSWKTKVPMAEGVFGDGTGNIRVVWFHQPYLAKMLPVGELVRLRGKISSSKSGTKYIANPEVERAAALPSFAKATEGLQPVYPESAGITSLWFYHAIQKVIKEGTLGTLEDPIPADILRRYNLPALKTALVFVHEPKKEKDAEAARKRFAFEEVFLIQLARARERESLKEKRAYEIDADEARVATFMKDSFSFTPTAGQKAAVGEILADFLEPSPMARLLEGDVGSGKTAVAAAAAYAVATSRPVQGKNFGNLQVAYMCPTEILAQQHFKTFTEFFIKHPLQIGLITGSGCYKFPSKVNPKEATQLSRAQFLKWVANGEIPIVIGTHALLQKSVTFKHLAFVIVDEQHRFGTAQRFALARGKTRTERGLNADKDTLLYRDLTYVIRQAIFEVKKNLGLGHKESVYSLALQEEFERRKISFSREVRIPILYHEKKVGTYVPDFVIDEKIILELKAIPFTGTKEKRQLWTYLKGSNYRLGLLVNFTNADVEINRIVYDEARDGRSASSRHESAFTPHLLSMTATPIPRTLALTIYGDLDLTVLDELPAGRKPIYTEIVSPGKRTTIYGSVRKLIEEGRQAYVICPRIDEPDPTKAMALQTKSVASEIKNLKKVFPEFTIDKLHSKMSPNEKEDVMSRFAAGTIDILVATSVVEVGVNVVNATVIMIEGAERFGLAQLHQLRGRVMRSSHPPYCYLMVESAARGESARLKAIVSAKNGFELAEKDLEIRGAGELYGRRQWGLSDIGMDALKNLKLVEAARKEAFDLVRTDPDLSHHPLLKELSDKKVEALHFE
jgi:GxxExxY protein